MSIELTDGKSKNYITLSTQKHEMDLNEKDSPVCINNLEASCIQNHENVVDIHKSIFYQILSTTDEDISFILNVWVIV